MLRLFSTLNKGVSMKKIGMIIAGGVGERMGANVPRPDRLNINEAYEYVSYHKKIYETRHKFLEIQK